MKPESQMLLSLHSLVRAILKEHSIENGYLIICKAMFPSFTLSTHRFRDEIHISDLQRICDDIYLLDKQELSYASCYSACIVAQVVAMSYGTPTEIVVGIKKQDKKIIGHAWLEWTRGQQTQIANPGDVNPRDFTEIKRLAPEPAIQTWMKQRAILDNAPAVHA